MMSLPARLHMHLRAAVHLSSLAVFDQEGKSEVRSWSTGRLRLLGLQLLEDAVLYCPFPRARKAIARSALPTMVLKPSRVVLRRQN